MPAVKKKQLSTPYFAGRLDTPGVVKHKRTSVPETYYQAIGEGVQTLMVEEPEHCAPGLSHLASRMPEPDEYELPHNSYRSFQYSNSDIPRIAGIPEVAEPDCLALQCCTGDLEASRPPCHNEPAVMPSNQPMKQSGWIHYPLLKGMLTK